MSYNLPKDLKVRIIKQKDILCLEKQILNLQKLAKLIIIILSFLKGQFFGYKTKKFFNQTKCLSLWYNV